MRASRQLERACELGGLVEMGVGDCCDDRKKCTSTVAFNEKIKRTLERLDPIVHLHS